MATAISTTITTTTTAQPRTVAGQDIGSCENLDDPSGPAAGAPQTDVPTAMSAVAGFGLATPEPNLLPHASSEPDATSAGVAAHGQHSSQTNRHDSATDNADASGSQRSYPTPGTVCPPRLDRGGLRPACAGRFDLEWDDPADARECKALCRQCPVRSECLQQALDNQEPWGIWGGLTVEERVDLARRQSRPTPSTLPAHGTNQRYCRHGCPCRACKDAHATYERAQREKRRQRQREQSLHHDRDGSGRSRWSTQSRSDL
jgi:hypothetical protein